MSVERAASDAGPIVVGVDGSEPGRHALLWARFLAETTGSTLVAVAAWQTPTSYGYVYLPPDWDPAGDARKALVETVDAVFGEDRPSGLEFLVREGYPPKVLLELSESARMLVVGSRGHGGFSGMLLGSVSATCTAHAHCPVLVVHGTMPPPPRGGSSRTGDGSR
ncbi:MAG: universal stress protein [Allobranchiibius sp.]